MVTSLVMQEIGDQEPIPSIPCRVSFAIVYVDHTDSTAKCRYLETETDLGLYKKHPELVEFYVVHAAGVDFWDFGAAGVADAKTGEAYL